MHNVHNVADFKIPYSVRRALQPAALHAQTEQVTGGNNAKTKIREPLRPDTRTQRSCFMLRQRGNDNVNNVNSAAPSLNELSFSPLRLTKHSTPHQSRCCLVCKLSSGRTDAKGETRHWGRLARRKIPKPANHSHGKPHARGFANNSCRLL
jgi:hypothetical protein